MTLARKPRKTHGVNRLGRLLALLPCSCILLYPLYEAAHVRLVRSELVCKRLPAAWDGVTVAFVSDLHDGALMPRSRLDDVIVRVNALNADILILGGDYANDSAGALAFFTEYKPRFSARLGVYAVMGNHDRTVPDARVFDIMRAMIAVGVTPLVNTSAILERDGQTLAICGVDDYYNGFPDPEAVRAQTRDANYTIFVTHSPDMLKPACRGGEWFDLALCGHTHGGQIAFFGWAPFPSCETGNAFRSGWYRAYGADILVSNGVGTTVLPVRLGAPPQFHIITLRCERAT